MSKHLHKLCALVLFCCVFLGSSTAWGQVNLQQSPYTENFDGMTTAYPNGWTGVRIAGSGTVGATINPVETDGSASSGAVYSAGNSTERALGSLASGSTIPAFGASFLNNTGGTLNKISVSGVMEQWRSGSNATQNEKVVFEYSLNATKLDDAAATWVAIPALDLNEILISTTAAAAVNGNDAANQANISADLTALNWANGGTLWIRWKDADNTGSDGIYAVDNFKIEFETNNTAPVIFTPSVLNLGETLIDKAQTGSYTFTATNLTAPVKVTADAPFLVSKTANGTYAAEIEFSAAELATEATVYVKVVPTAFGAVNGNITHTSIGATATVVAATVMSHSPYGQDFNTCTGNTTIAGGWIQYSVTGAQNWACTTFGQQGNGVQMSGYGNSTNNENEDWLISPAMDFSGMDIPLISINYRTKFAGNDLKIKVSTNYSGAGDPTAATWTDLATLAADDADVWKLLENLGLQNHKSANTYIAFVYTSTTESAARWTLDNFLVTGVENFLNTSGIVMNFPETASGSKSDAMKFTFSAVGFDQDVVLSVPANFELSKDGNTYAATLTYTATEAAAENEVFVRFAPTTTAHLSTGPVTFTSGQTVFTRGVLSGSSLLKAGTLDVVTWNMKWFGATGQGPTNEELQFENAKKVIQHLNADIIGVQEVADDTKIAELAAATGYTYITKPVTGQQQIGFLYKADVVTVRKDKVLLSKLFDDIKAGTVDLPDYPTGDQLFWASGRLPYLVEFEANIAGAKQRIHVINLHAKANGDNNTLDYQRRQYDAKVLSDSLAAQYGDVNLILLGDFNDDVDVSIVGTNQKSSFDVFVANEANYKTLTMDLSKADKATYESGSLRSFLDHIFISNELEDEYVAGSVAIEDQVLSLIPNFRATTSDHLPVSARFIVTATTYPATVTFSQASVSKAEDAGTFAVSLTLSEAIATEQTVTIAPKAGATASTADYTIAGATNGAVTVTVPANTTTATFNVTIVDDTEIEADEQVVFEITNKSADLTIGTAKTFTLTITDNDKATVTFAAATKAVSEDAGVTEVTLNLNKAHIAEQTITVAVTNGTGVTYGAAGDYTTTPAVANGNLVVTVPAGATTAKFNISVNNDTETEAAEQIAFEISGVSNGLLIGTAKTYAFTIEANDAVTGIADGTKGEFSVYPTVVNSGNVRLQLPERVATTAKVNMVVYGTDGRKVLNTTGTQTAVQTTLNDNIQSLPAGMYIVLIETGKEYFQTKMVKR